MHSSLSNPGQTSRTELKENVQPKKVRRIKETLFIREIERLADEMCKEATPHQGTAGGALRSTATTENHVPPTQLSTSHIREHLTSIQDKIKDVITDVARPGQGSGNLTFGTGVPQGGFQSLPEPPNFMGTFSGPSNSATGYQGVTSPTSTYDPRGFNDDDVEGDVRWDLQQVTHISQRLRQAERIPAGGSSSRTLGCTGGVMTPRAPAEDRNLVVVRKFETGKSGNFSHLDVDMDGNTACLSTRKKDPKLQAMSNAMTPRLPAVVSSPRRPEVQTIIEEQRKRQVLESAEGVAEVVHSEVPSGQRRRQAEPQAGGRLPAPPGQLATLVPTKQRQRVVLKSHPFPSLNS